MRPVRFIWVIALVFGGSVGAPADAETDSLPALPPIEFFGAEEDAILLTPENRGFAIASARLAARYMAGTVSEDGAFGYEFDFLAGRWSERDNIVRQAGAVSVLGAYLAKLGRDPSVETALKRAIARMDRSSLPYGGGRLVSGNDDLSGAEIGATALALHGELLYAHTTGDQSFLPARAAWLAALAYHWNPETGMHRTPVRRERSAYYDGEAWLAVATYHRLFPEDTVALDLIRSMDAALMSTYATEPNVSFFHWGELAARERHLVSSNDAFVRFGADQAKIFRSKMRPYIDHLNNTCFSVEGLAAAWWLIEDAPDLAEYRAELRNRVLNEQHKNATLQIRPHQTSFEPSDGVVVSSDRMADFAGAYLNGRNRLQTRIDVTQHCLNAWLQMLG